MSNEPRAGSDFADELNEHTARRKESLRALLTSEDEANMQLIHDAITAWVGRVSIQKFRMVAKSGDTAEGPIGMLADQCIYSTKFAVSRLRAESDDFPMTPPELALDIAVDLLTSGTILYEKPRFGRSSTWVPFAALAEEVRSALLSRLAEAKAAGEARWEPAMRRHRQEDQLPPHLQAGFDDTVSNLNETIANLTD